MSAKMFFTSPVDMLNRWYTNATTVSQPVTSEDGTLIFDRNGSIYLNYNNDNVQKKINKHIDQLSQVELKR